MSINLESMLRAAERRAVVAAGLVRRSGTTSATRYRIVRVREEQA